MVEKKNKMLASILTLIEFNNLKDELLEKFSMRFFGKKLNKNSASNFSFDELEIFRHNLEKYLEKNQALA